MTPTPIYRSIMLEVERRRLQLGLSMDRLSEIAGIADRAYSKALWAETVSGRVARYETLQCILDVLFPDGFDVAIKPKNGPELDALSLRYKVRCAAAANDVKIQRELMAELGRKGAENRNRHLSPFQRRQIARKAGLASGRKRRRGPASQVIS